MSKYWTVVLPGCIIGVVYYAYNAEGFVSRKVQSLVNPLLQLGHSIVGFIFGI